MKRNTTEAYVNPDTFNRKSNAGKDMFDTMFDLQFSKPGQKKKILYKIWSKRTYRFVLFFKGKIVRATKSLSGESLIRSIPFLPEIGKRPNGVEGRILSERAYKNSAKHKEIKVIGNQ